MAAVAVALVQGVGGGRVFLRGELIYAWAGGDAVLPRLAAVRLVTIKAVPVADVAAVFGVGAVTLWRRTKELGTTVAHSGLACLAEPGCDVP